MWKSFWKKPVASQHGSSEPPQPVLLPELTLNALLGWQKYQNALGSRLRVRSSSTLAGQHRSSIQGKGIELSEIRNYQPGDDIRLMDWKVTARTRKPHTRVFLEEKERPVQLVLDLSASMLFGSVRSKAEQAANTAATLGWSFTHQGDRCGGIIFNGEQHRLIKPGARKKGLLPFLKQSCDLSEAIVTPHGPSTPGRMNQLLEHLMAQPGHGHLIILISDFWSLDLENCKVLSELSRKHHLLAIHITDQLEYELPEGPCYINQGNQSLFFDGSQFADRKRYRQQAENRCQALESLFRKNRGHWLALTTEENPPERLMQYFC